MTRSIDGYSGKILIGNVDIQQLSLPDIHAKIAVALQDSLLFSGTIRDNLTYGAPNAPDSQLESAAVIADAEEFITHLPQHFDATVEQKGKNFSGGQRQRLNIARALVPDPDILIMDDATSAVDQTTNAQIKDQLATTRKHKTTIIISQRVTNVIDCDQIIVLEDGKLAAQGTHAQLLQRSSFYQHLVKTQLGGGRFGHE